MVDDDGAVDGLTVDESVGPKEDGRKPEGDTDGNEEGISEGNDEGNDDGADAGAVVRGESVSSNVGTSEG